MDEDVMKMMAAAVKLSQQFDEAIAMLERYEIIVSELTEMIRQRDEIIASYNLGMSPIQVRH
jgi:hypothetical protein